MISSVGNISENITIGKLFLYEDNVQLIKQFNLFLWAGTYLIIHTLAQAWPLPH